MSDPVQVDVYIPRKGDSNTSPFPGSRFQDNPLAEAIQRARSYIGGSINRSDRWHVMQIPEVLSQLQHPRYIKPSPAPSGIAEFRVKPDGQILINHSVRSLDFMDAHSSLNDILFWLEEHNNYSTPGTLVDSPEGNMVCGAHPRSPAHQLIAETYFQSDTSSLRGSRRDGRFDYAFTLPLADPERPVEYGEFRVADIFQNPIMMGLLGPHDLVAEYVNRKATTKFGSKTIDSTIEVVYDELIVPGKIYAATYEEVSSLQSPQLIGRLRFTRHFWGPGSVTVIPNYEFKELAQTKRKTQREPVQSTTTSDQGSRATVVIPNARGVWGGLAGFGKGITQKFGDAIAYLLGKQNQEPQQTPAEGTQRQIWDVPAGIENNFSPPQSAPIRDVRGDIDVTERNPLEVLVEEIGQMGCGGCQDLLSSQPSDALAIGKDQVMYHGSCFDELVAPGRRGATATKTDLGVSYEVMYVGLDVLAKGKAKFDTRAELLDAMKDLRLTLQRYGLTDEYDRRMSQTSQINSGNPSTKKTIRINPKGNPKK